MSQWQMKIARPFGRVETHKDPVYLDGLVATPHGWVYVYSEPEGRGHTSVQFIVAGRLHSRTIKKPYTARGLVTLAARYAEEMTEQDHA